MLNDKAWRTVKMFLKNTITHHFSLSSDPTETSWVVQHLRRREKTSPPPSGALCKGLVWPDQGEHTALTSPVPQGEQKVGPAAAPTRFCVISGQQSVI